jgi:predicted nucleic acid-binding protein
METSKTRVIIADTSGLVSLFNPLDSNHEAAVSEALRLRRARVEVVVPIAVYLEFANILGRILGHRAAVRAAEEVSESFELLNNFSSSLVVAALRIFEKAPARVSHTDCVVMASCDEYETRDIFGFDEDFTRQGYLIITSQPTQDAA